LRKAADAHDRLLAVAADLATEAGVATVVERTVDAFGGLDILVNNVGLARE
jgi:NAD(P)-dependent dehydrogenase (short-subunit alcohol dehydrogenase family)